MKIYYVIEGIQKSDETIANRTRAEVRTIGAE